MPRTIVTVGRSRSQRDRLRAAQRSLVASGLVPTYDLLYGSQCGLLFEHAVLEAGYRETSGGWWPTEERTLHAEGAVFREGDTGAVYQLPDGTLVRAELTGDSIRLSVAGPTRASVNAALATFQGMYPASFVVTEGDSRVPITFWSNSPFGPQPRLRRIDATAWEPIVGNYTGEVAAQLADLMAWHEPGTEGQLILWQGPPGTGKTWALRALASEWAPWAEFNYITDPDSFFVDDPSYMVNVLLSESYAVIDSEGGIYEEQAEGKWRVLILEDTGELLSANAKEKYGQGLSRLLNVVDGMIGQGLRVLCLVTTNDELGELNEAVRRPGRCASQIVFAPLDDAEAQAWTGDPEATAGTIAELYSRYGKAERPAEFTDEPEDARDLMASLRAEFANPVTFTDDELRGQIARVAAEHQPDGGYGETAWHEGDRIVFWVSADWTSNEEVEAAQQAFLAIDGVDGVESEAEAYLPDGDGWERVYPGLDGDDELAALVALASEPLILERDLVASAPRGYPIDAAVRALTRAHERTVDGLTTLVASAATQRGSETSDLLAAAAIQALERFAERPADPAPNVTVNVPERETHVHMAEQPITVNVPEQAPQAAPHVDVHVAAAEAPQVTVMAAEPAPVHVDVHVPEQAPAIVHVAPAPVHVAMPTPEPRPSAVRIDFDDQGNRIFIPEYEPEEAA